MGKQGDFQNWPVGTAPRSCLGWGWREGRCCCRTWRWTPRGGCFSFSLSLGPVTLPEPTFDQINFKIWHLHCTCYLFSSFVTLPRRNVFTGVSRNPSKHSQQTERNENFQNMIKKLKIWAKNRKCLEEAGLPGDQPRRHVRDRLQDRHRPAAGMSAFTRCKKSSYRIGMPVSEFEHTQWVSSVLGDNYSICLI